MRRSGCDSCGGGGDTHGVVLQVGGVLRRKILKQNWVLRGSNGVIMTKGRVGRDATTTKRTAQ